MPSTIDELLAEEYGDESCADESYAESLDEEAKRNAIAMRTRPLLPSVENTITLNKEQAMCVFSKIQATMVGLETEMGNRAHCLFRQRYESNNAGWDEKVDIFAYSYDLCRGIHLVQGFLREHGRTLNATKWEGSLLPMCPYSQKRLVYIHAHDVEEIMKMLKKAPKQGSLRLIWFMGSTHEPEHEQGKFIARFNPRRGNVAEYTSTWSHRREWVEDYTKPFIQGRSAMINAQKGVSRVCVRQMRLNANDMEWMQAMETASDIYFTMAGTMYLKFGRDMEGVTSSSRGGQ